MYATKLSPSALIELQRLDRELRSITEPNGKPAAPGTLPGSQRKRVDAILGQMAAIRSTGITDDDFLRAKAEAFGLEINGSETRRQEAHENLFRMFLSGVDDSKILHEQRTNNDFLAGSATPAYTSGSAGGFLVPMKFSQSVAEGLAQTDALFDEKVCTVVQEDGFVLNPLQLPGWDLSTIKATKVGEASQHNSDVIPATTQKLLNKFTYRLSLGASMEWEEDQRAFDTALAAMGRAYGVGFARAIGQDLISGDGSTGPSGIIHGLSTAVTTNAAGVVVADDIANVFFAVDPVYRGSAKCAWLMNDAAYELVRKAKDSNNRPLISVESGINKLYGKPVYTCPSLPTTAGTAGSFCVFGDLSHYVVHLSTMMLRRSLQTPGFVENGLALYKGLLMADAVLLDPTGGNTPPVVAAALHN